MTNDSRVSDKFADQLRTMFGRKPGEPLFPVARDGQEFVNAYIDDAGNWVFPNAEAAPAGLLPVTLQLHERSLSQPFVMPQRPWRDGSGAMIKEFGTDSFPVVLHEYGHGLVDEK